MTDNAGAGAGGTENAGAGNGAGGAGGDPWFKGAAPELVAHMQTHGWDKKPINEAALAAVQSHYSASKLIGADPNSVLKLPKDAADEAGWNGVYEKLGVPKDGVYTFEGLKFADGKPPEKEFTDWLTTQAKALHLTPNQAQQMAQAEIKRVDDTVTKAAGETTAAIQVEREALKKNWGANWDTNLFLAKKGAEALGFTKEVIDTLQRDPKVGYGKVMEAMLAVGQKSGEARFVMNQGGPAAGVLSRDQAIARKAELMTDTAWVARYTAGGQAELREMMAVNTIIVGGQQAAP